VSEINQDIEQIIGDLKTLAKAGAAQSPNDKEVQFAAAAVVAGLDLLGGFLQDVRAIALASEGAVVRGMRDADHG
jgi:hypothetical protein